LQHSFGEHYVELGTYGFSADLFPRPSRSFGTDHVSDAAIDASYQWSFLDNYTLAAYATYIWETRDQHASHLLFGTLDTDRSKTFRANVSFTIADTYTLNAQRFSTIGTGDRAFVGFASGNPNSAGWIGELDYTPTGKGEDSILPKWLNLKLALQYVGYTR